MLPRILQWAVTEHIQRGVNKNQGSGGHNRGEQTWAIHGFSSRCECREAETRKSNDERCSVTRFPIAAVCTFARRFLRDKSIPVTRHVHPRNRFYRPLRGADRWAAIRGPLFVLARATTQANSSTDCERWDFDRRVGRILHRYDPNKGAEDKP